MLFIFDRLGREYLFYLGGCAVKTVADLAAFDALLDSYRALSDSERLKGNYLEQLTRQYLLNDAQMKRQFCEVWLWKDWPDRAGRPDCGIDLVAQGRDGSLAAVQCKFYAPGYHIQKSDLDSFLSESGKAPFSRRIYVETTGETWSANAESAIEGQQIPVTRVGLTDFRTSNIDWSTFQKSDPSAGVAVLPQKTLRNHQARALADVFKGFETHDRGTLVMACGTGKTFTSLKIAEHLVELNGGTAKVLFMVPSLALMTQTLSEWSAECSEMLHSWAVCSDTKVNRRKTDDLTDIAAVDLKIPPTTNGADLAKSAAAASTEDGLHVVFATYQSIDVVTAAQKAGMDDFDLIICDEAHRTTGVTLAGDNESHFVKIHSNNNVRSDRRLYMTATPRIFNENTRQKATEKDAVLASMDDQTIYGPIFHRLSFGQAVGEGLLTDYKVVVLAISEDQVSRIYQSVANDEGELPLTDMAKLVGCWNAMAKRRSGEIDVSYGQDTAPMRRAVAFAKDIKTSKRIAHDFADLVRIHLQDLDNTDTTDNLGVQCQHVDGTMNAIERGEKLDWLKEGESSKDSPVCRVLTNARCLSEGVDVPTLDAVFFLNPRRSQVDVIQAVGRVMRKAEGKEFGYIVLPVAIPAGMSPEEALADNQRFKATWQVLQAIRAHDERFDNTINKIEFNTSSPENIIVDMVNLPRPAQSQDIGQMETPPQKGEREPRPQQAAFTFPVEEWKDAVYSKIVKKVGTRLYWDDWSKDIADIAARYINLIENLLENQQHKDLFGEFTSALRSTLNPQISNAEAVEMLAQHIITKPLFDAMFPDQTFTEQNPVSRAMQKMLDALATDKVFEKEREPLESFYKTMVSRIEDIDNIAGKQRIMVTLYDRFFSKAFPTMADRLGIVFTPIEVVDYILHSADDALYAAFGKHLGDRGVSIIETFMSQRIQTRANYDLAA
ncbi:helicase protein [Winkia neuii]|nr:helicase protein [Winkia neuii]